MGCIHLFPSLSGVKNNFAFPRLFKCIMFAIRKRRFRQQQQHSVFGWFTSFFCLYKISLITVYDLFFSELQEMYSY